MAVPRTHLEPSLGDLYDHLDATLVEGTPELLTTGTDTTPRLWTAEQIADYVDSIVNA